jgi:hypothetical protein
LHPKSLTASPDIFKVSWTVKKLDKVVKARTTMRPFPRRNQP